MAGGASIDANTVNQFTDRVIINWGDFSIGANEVFQFNQPSSSSVALNRVISGNPSSILGKLNANGNVYLINPNGILVGAGASINCNSFVASTLDVSNESFIAGGDLKFSGNSTAKIENLGKINSSEDIFFIARKVVNTGNLSAGKNVGIAVGEEVLLQKAGEERLFVEVGKTAVGGTGIDQRGLIESATVELKAAGGNIYALAINNEGSIRATGVENRHGHVFLKAQGSTVKSTGTIVAKNSNQEGGSVAVEAGNVALSGLVDVSGTKGGKVTVTGNEVSLTKSTINASGTWGGGAIRIGGGYQGGEGILAALQTAVDAGSLILVDAIEQGDGGSAVVWADGSTTFEGMISARGGSVRGNGGEVEVSGKKELSFAGLVDTSASHGITGNLLLDPEEITIGLVNPNNGTSFMSVSQLATNLNTTSVTVQSNGALAGNGNITLASDLSWSSNNTLALTASNNVQINANITYTGNSARLALTPGTGGAYSLAYGSTITATGANAGLAIAGVNYTLIHNAIDLQKMLLNTAGSYAVAENIDASVTSPWNGGAGFRPVGDGTQHFSGNFDGLGHTIEKLTIDRPTQNFVGLFGSSTGNIQNTALTAASISGDGAVGGLVGAVISGNVKQTSVNGTVQGNVLVGGLVGANNGTIDNSFTSGTVIGKTDIVGGVVGRNFQPAKINQSFSDAHIVAFNTAGGLVGNNLGRITQSYATGSVSGNQTVGGLVGSNDGILLQTYAAGKVSGTSAVGGLIGSTGGTAIVVNSWWATDATGQNSSAGGLPITIDQLLGKSGGVSLAGLGFSTPVWNRQDGTTLPYLTWSYGNSGQVYTSSNTSSILGFGEPSSSSFLFSFIDPLTGQFRSLNDNFVENHSSRGSALTSLYYADFKPLKPSDSKSEETITSDNRLGINPDFLPGNKVVDSVINNTFPEAKALLIKILADAGLPVGRS